MATPFIQLFKTPRSRYVFDVNMNEILPISTESFSFLKKCMSGEADVTSSEIAEINDLRQAGYLKTESVVEKIYHPYTPFLNDLLERKIPKATLQLTQRCNLRCKYCIYSEDVNMHQRSHSNKDMHWETAKKSIDFLREHSVDSTQVNIGFYGGEPLLRFSLIKQIVAYAREKFDGKELAFTITTNGTLLNEEIISYFEKEDVQLMISLDGPKEIHDKNRVFPNGQGSFDTVMENLERLKAIAPDYAKKVSFSMVMDPINDYDCINQITITTREHHFLASLVDKGYDEGKLIYSEEYLWKSRYQEFLAVLSMFNRFPSTDVSAIARNVVGRFIADRTTYQNSNPLRKVDVPSGPCTPGQLRLFVDVNGRLFPCERVSENSKSTCLGTIDDGFDLYKTSALLNVGSITEKECKKCWAFRFCVICVKQVDDGTPALSAVVKRSHCNEIRYNAYEKIRRIIFLKEIDDIYYSEQTRQLDR